MEKIKVKNDEELDFQIKKLHVLDLLAFIKDRHMIRKVSSLSYTMKDLEYIEEQCLSVIQGRGF